jgi:hypothetical protein
VKRGYLSEYFVGVGVKSLAATEIDPLVSRGHELQGVEAFQRFLGVPAEKRKIPATYVWLSDSEEPLAYEGTGTWYDSRRGKSHREPETRLYYPTAAEPVIYRARAGDTLFAAYGRDGRLALLFCTSGSSIERQLLWLFNLSIQGDDLVVRDIGAGPDVELGPAARYVLGLIGIDAAVEDADWLAKLERKFGDSFPTTARFSAIAREWLGPIDFSADPDAALLRWLEFEELLFFTFERHLIGERLEAGFVDPKGVAKVDAFVRFSLSVQNRRKARAGYSLENHLEFLFKELGLQHERGARTEGKRKPDFLFPGSAQYADLSVPADRLTLLGSKSSCKDRWRQVLSEGARVPEKHLITLEPGISRHQTDEMQQEGLQLVLPRGLFETYQADQRGWLMSLEEFIALVQRREALS